MQSSQRRAQSRDGESGRPLQLVLNVPVLLVTNGLKHAAFGLDKDGKASPLTILPPARGVEGGPCVLSRRNEDHRHSRSGRKPGLYQVLASGSASIVVESMVDGKRSSIPGTVRVSNLADITMYTHDEDVSCWTF